MVATPYPIVKSFNAPCATIIPSMAIHAHLLCLSLITCQPLRPLPTPTPLANPYVPCQPCALANSTPHLRCRYDGSIAAPDMSLEDFEQEIARLTTSGKTSVEDLQARVRELLALPTVLLVDLRDILGSSLNALRETSASKVGRAGFPLCVRVGHTVAKMCESKMHHGNVHNFSPIPNLDRKTLQPTAAN